jgi:hypothetical protein
MVGVINEQIIGWISDLVSLDTAYSVLDNDFNGGGWR